VIETPHVNLTDPDPPRVPMQAIFEQKASAPIRLVDYRAPAWQVE
jgi:hypothetical protein